MLKNSTMDIVERYRQVFMSFKDMCASGTQNCTFSQFCREQGMEADQMRKILKDEFEPIRSLKGYRRPGNLYREVYDNFRLLCAEGRQSQSFAEYYRGYGLRRKQVEGYMWRNKLRISELPGYRKASTGHCRLNSGHQEIPFEDIVFEETGFLPVPGNPSITVKVWDHVAVSFPADTDIDIIAGFIKKMGKEVGHVGA